MLGSVLLDRLPRFAAFGTRYLGCDEGVVEFCVSGRPEFIYCNREPFGAGPVRDEEPHLFVADHAF